jgi:hypothetical protein
MQRGSCANVLVQMNRRWGSTLVAGHHPPRLSVSRNAQLLLHHARRNPALSCRTAANSNGSPSGLMRRTGSLPISLQVSAALPVAAGPVAHGVQRVAEHAIRVATDVACQAEQAARLADEARRSAHRGKLVAASFGAVAALFGIAVVAGSHINMRTDAEMATVANALRQLDATEHQINDQLTALHASSATQATLVAPGGPTPVMPISPVAAPPVTAPVAPIGPALPVAIKPLPPVTWSVPGGSAQRQRAHHAPVQRARLDRTAPSKVMMAKAAAETAG